MPTSVRDEPLRTPVPRIERRLLRDEALLAIRDLIVNGTLRPGERVDVQRLVEWLEMTQTPIQQALHVLDSEGFIETHPQRYARVTNPAPAQGIDANCTMGYLLGSVAHVTFPTLTSRGRSNFAHHLDLLTTAASEESDHLFTGHLDAFYRHLAARCPNTALRDLSMSQIEILRFLVQASGVTAIPDWKTVRDALSVLSAAMKSGDGIIGRQAIEVLHHSTAPEERESGT